MKLSTIIKATAERMSDVSVDVRTNYGTVCISDDTGTHADIFLQGDEAENFIILARNAYDECGYVTMSDCYLWQAEQYIECLWN